MNAPRKNSIPASAVIGTLVVLVVAALCVRFGFWQLDRLDQKRTRNALIQVRGAEPPITITAALQDTAGVLDRRAIVQGHFDNDHSIVLPGRSYLGAPGVYVLTPLMLQGSASAILVNRGWVPSADASTIVLDSLREHGDQRIEGLIQAFPATRTGATSTATTDTFRTHWFSIDPDRLRAQFPYSMLPVQLQALPAENTPRYPRRLEPPVLDEGPHLSYAVQWFSFAIIAVVGWLTIVMRRGNSNRAGQPAGTAESEN